MNALAKITLMLAFFTLPLSVNATHNSDTQDFTAIKKMDIVKLVDNDMKLNMSELVQRVKVVNQKATSSIAKAQSLSYPLISRSVYQENTTYTVN